MNVGVLGGATLATDTEKKLYTVPADALVATFIASFCNKTLTNAVVKLAIGPGTKTTDAGTYYLEYNADVEVGTPLERTGVTIQTGWSVWATSDTNDIDVVLMGYEKAKV